MTTPAWVVMADGGLRCVRCGTVETMSSPMPVDAFGPWCEYVGALHRGCADTGRVDVLPASVAGWIAGHDTGVSSKAIYRHMMGMIRDAHGSRWGDTPRDPSDFGRCYRLLAIAPHWRNRIGEMARYSKEWAALAEAWDELTEMYEAAFASGAKNAPDLYRRMKELAP